MTPVFFKAISRLVRWLDPRLQKYRPKKITKPYTPSSEADLIKLLKRTPKDVLSKDQRALIAGAMSFDRTPVSKIMTPLSAMLFLKNTDFLGPLILDKLYKSGANYFVVLGSKKEISGLINTKNLDPLRISEDTPVSHFLDSTVFYIRADYSLDMALAAFLRTGANFLLVVNHDAEIIGSLDFSRLISVLFGHDVSDSFESDANLQAVSLRSSS